MKAVRVFLLTSFCALFALGASGDVTGPSTSTGNYTVSWNANTCFADFYRFYENSSFETIGYGNCSGSRTYSGKPVGSYTYRLESCFFYEDPFQIVCNENDSSHTVNVTSGGGSGGSSGGVGYNSSYQVKTGNYNSDSFADFFIQKPSSSGGVRSLVLSWNAGIQDYLIITNLSSAQINNFSSWPVANSLQKSFEDLNMDETIDLYIGNADAYIPGAHDVVVYSSPNGLDTPHGTTAVTNDVVEFFDQAYSLVPDDDFFANATSQQTLQGGNYYFGLWFFTSPGYIIKAFNFFGQPIYEYISSPGYHAAWIYVATTTTITVINPGVSAEAFNFAPIFNRVFGTGIVPGSQDSISIDSIFTGIIRTQIAKGALANSGVTLPGESGMPIPERSKNRLLKLIRLFSRWLKILTPIQVGIDTANHPFYHYTDQGGFNGISASANISSSQGFAFFTTDVYVTGVSARAKLALDKTPIGAFVFPFYQIATRYRSGPTQVAPANGQPGLGIEYTFNTPIFVPPETPFMLIQ